MEINNLDTMKPIIFTGDSFIWGEGLELYDEKIENWIKPIFEKKQVPYDYNFVHNFSADGSPSYFRGQWRFPQLVSDYFNTFFLTNTNGGSNHDAFKYAETILDFYEPENFSYIIMNVTSLNRDQYHITRNDILKDFGVDIGDNGKSLYNFIESWYAWCSIGNFDKEFYSDSGKFEEIFINSGRTPTFDIDSSQKIQTYFFEIDGFIKYLNTIQFKYYETKFEYFKNQGHSIKFIGHWNDYDSKRFSEISPEVTNFITSNLIQIEYDGKVFNELSELQKYGELWIDTDKPWTKNKHPSKLFHKVIADSVIKYIENLENPK